MTQQPSRPLTWARLPTGWIRYKGGLLRFPGGTRAQGVSAIKLYLAVLAAAAEQEITHGRPRGEARLTYDELADRAVVSRGLLPDALLLLASRIERIKGRGRNPNVYRLLDYDERGYGQLPVGWIWHREANVLAQFSAHRRSDLNALKLYLLLLAHRRQSTNTTNLSYNKMTEYTGIHPPRIAEALAVLASAGLIRVSPGEVTADELGEEIDLSAPTKHRPANVYRFLGLKPLGRPTESLTSREGAST